MDDGENGGDRAGDEGREDDGDDALEQDDRHDDGNGNTSTIVTPIPGFSLTLLEF